MNSLKLIASLALIVTSSSVLAESQTYPYVDFSGFQSTRTRAEVNAELETHQARVNRDHEYPSPGAGFVSTRSRAEVLAELRQSIAEGSYAQLDFESAPQMPRYYGNSSLARAEEAQ